MAMTEDASCERAIKQYLDEVALKLTGLQPRQRGAVLHELRDHIREAVHERAPDRPATLQDVYAALADIDTPEQFARAVDQAESRGESGWKLELLALICALMQVGGLVAVAAGVPVLPGIAGFATIVAFFLMWARYVMPRWLFRLMAVCAVCGLGSILFEIARAL